jgi:hypothetical protein
MKIKAFGLLHLNRNEKTAVNVKTSGFDEQIKVYVANAISLSNSLQAQGITFTLLTNDKAYLQQCAAAFRHPLHIEEIPFTTPVPSGIKFYSAHFKLDAFRYLALQSDGYLMLCDLDMLCINPLPDCLKNMMAANIPVCYDISDQVIPVYGQHRLLNDLQAMHGLPSEGRWTGGEFIAGPATFFQALCTEIDSIFPRYLAHIKQAFHVGDEAFTSAAIEVLRRRGTYIADAGTLGIVGRYWSGPLGHPQKPFCYFKQCFMLHLPGDKYFLQSLANRGAVTLPEFNRLYLKRRYSPLVLVKKYLHPLRRRMRELRAG